MEYDEPGIEWDLVEWDRQCKEWYAQWQREAQAQDLGPDPREWVYWERMVE